MQPTLYAYPGLGLYGRLGNQFWQVAATLARARAAPAGRPGFPSDWEYRNYVNLPADWYRPPTISENTIDVARLPDGPYFQSLEFIEPLTAKELRHLFGPSRFGSERLEAHHGPRLIQVASNHYTAIHVRRTDYLENPDRFPQLTPQFWHRAVKEARAENPDTTFLVFSDDIPWCQENAEEAFGLTTGVEFVAGHVRPIPPRARVGEPADIFDLWLMAMCRAHIIANSTYSWWGAYLSEQALVYYPDRWFGPGAIGYDTYMWRAFPASWRMLPC